MTAQGIEVRICAYCGEKFEVATYTKKLYCSNQCSGQGRKTATPPRKFRYQARGIVQDNVHPNDRGKDMSQHHATFKIDEDGRVITR